MDIENNPKVAVLLFGNMRSFNVTYRNLEAYLLSQYNCDLYICTYDKRFNIKHDSSMKEEIMEYDAIKNIYGKYLKHLTIIPQDTFIEPFTRMHGKKYVFDGDLDRLYTIQKLAMTAYDIFIGECSRNSRHYDYIIRLRPDILLNNKFHINFSINNDNIIVPSNDSGGGFNDHIAYGRHHVMHTYLTYYRSFHEIDRMNDGKLCDVSIVEDGLRKYLEFSKLEIIRNPIHYIILRDSKPQKIIYMGKGQYFVKKY